VPANCGSSQTFEPATELDRGACRKQPRAVLYTSNGEVRQESSIVLTARVRSGQPTPSTESSEVRWVPASDVPGYTIDRSMRIRINDFLTPGKPPVIT
jgi:hypothetical protein